MPTPAFSVFATKHNTNHIVLAETPKCINMFEKVLEYFKQNQGDNIQITWENPVLVQEGFLPCLIPSHIITNERFGYVSKQKRYEWNIPSIKLLRYYWNAMLLGYHVSYHRYVRSVCSKLLETLPGPREECSKCGWSMPGSEMWNVTTCSYCHEREMYPDSKLIFIRGVPVISPNPTLESRLIHNFQSLRLERLPK